MKIQNFKNLSILRNKKSSNLLVQFSKNTFTTKSHLQQIVEREKSMLDKLRNGSNFSQEEMGEFARILKKSNFEKELWQNFEKELPKYISNFDEFELRKIISLTLSANNNGMMQNDSIIDSLSDRLDVIYTEKDRNGLSLEQFKVNKRNYFNSLPLAYKFYIKMYAMRCSFMDMFKNYGISSK